MGSTSSMEIAKNGSKGSRVTTRVSTCFLRGLAPAGSEDSRFLISLVLLDTILYNIFFIYYRFSRKVLSSLPFYVSTINTICYSGSDQLSWVVAKRK